MGLIYCLIYAGAIGFLSFLLGRGLPEALSRPDRFPYTPFSWEDGGRIYERLFHIKSWQARVPDMSKIFPGLMQAKKVTRDFKQELPCMIRETCIAELVHGALCLLSLPCLWIWPGPGGKIFTFLYILGNLPFIMIQRYNRPRLLKLQKKLAQSERKAAYGRFDTDLQHRTGA